ncbi:PD1L1 protein, partial [Corythaeola cristata]|nr:PD1L1 protein [Corythaeola cristata]
HTLIPQMKLFSFPAIALFTVEVPQQLYVVEYGRNVTMECRFPVNGSLNLGLLTVVWEQKRQGQSKSREVYTLRNGKAFPPSQHHDYAGRAALLHSELRLGRAILQVTDVKITDAGSYLCLIDYQGVDYKYITLEVKASYKRINTQVMRKPGEDKFVFMCQSEGFPLAEVFWRNEKNFNLSGSANTTYTLTTDGLYNVTSILTFKPSTSENYSCVFWNKEPNGETSA